MEKKNQEKQKNLLRRFYFSPFKRLFFVRVFCQIFFAFCLWTSLDAMNLSNANFTSHFQAFNALWCHLSGRLLVCSSDILPAEHHSITVASPSASLGRLLHNLSLCEISDDDGMSAQTKKTGLICAPFFKRGRNTEWSVWSWGHVFLRQGRKFQKSMSQGFNWFGDQFLHISECLLR